MHRTLSSIFGVIALPFLTACGSVTPDIIQNPSSETQIGRFVNRTALHVRCELQYAIFLAIKNNDAYFLDKWSAKITLTLGVDEKLNLAAGANVSETFVGSTLKSLSLGFGGALNQRAVRKIEVTWYESFPELRAANMGECRDPPAPRIEGNLKLVETLFSGIFPATAEGAAFRGFADKAGPLESIQNTITFNIETGATANPSFVLKNVVFNQGGPSILANRDRSDQLLITMGPGYIEKTGRPLVKTVVRPSQEVIEAHNAGRIGLQFQTFLPQRF